MQIVDEIDEDVEEWLGDVLIKEQSCEERNQRTHRHGYVGLREEMGLPHFQAIVPLGPGKHAR